MFSWQAGIAGNALLTRSQFSSQIRKTVRHEHNKRVSRNQKNLDLAGTGERGRPTTSSFKGVPRVHEASKHRLKSSNNRKLHNTGTPNYQRPDTKRAIATVTDYVAMALASLEGRLLLNRLHSVWTRQTKWVCPCITNYQECEWLTYPIMATSPGGGQGVYCRPPIPLGYPIF